MFALFREDHAKQRVWVWNLKAAVGRGRGNVADFVLFCEEEGAHASQRQPKQYK